MSAPDSKSSRTLSGGAGSTRQGSVGSKGRWGQKHKHTHLALGATARLITGSGTEMEVMARLQRGQDL